MKKTPEERFPEDWAMGDQGLVPLVEEIREPGWFEKHKLLLATIGGTALATGVVVRGVFETHKAQTA